MREIQYVFVIYNAHYHICYYSVVEAAGLTMHLMMQRNKDASVLPKPIDQYNWQKHFEYNFRDVQKGNEFFSVQTDVSRTLNN